MNIALSGHRVFKKPTKWSRPKIINRPNVSLRCEFTDRKWVSACWRFKGRISLEVFFSVSATLEVRFGLLEIWVHELLLACNYKHILRTLSVLSMHFELIGSITKYTVSHRPIHLTKCLTRSSWTIGFCKTTDIFERVCRCRRRLWASLWRMVSIFSHRK